MNVAIVIRHRWFRASIDMEGCCAALRRMGHEPSLVCLGNDVGDPGFPVVEATREQMESPDFWRSLQLDAAIFYCWLRGSAIVRAMRTAGVRVVLRADSDGCASVRVFPRAAWGMTVEPAHGPVERLRRIKHFVHRYLALYRKEDAELAATVGAADATAIEFPRAAKNLGRILDSAGRSELRSKVHVVPHSLRDDFLGVPPALEGPREVRVFSLARWEDPQKDAPLLAAAIREVLAARKDVTFEIAGPGGDFPEFRREPRVELAGKVPPDSIPSRLARCRVFLSSSRWEGQSIIGLESLCSGMTIVAPPVPCFEDMVAESRAGRISATRGASDLARALLAELSDWDAGLRSPADTAGLWRPRVSNDAVTSALLALLPA